MGVGVLAALGNRIKTTTTQSKQNAKYGPKTQFKLLRPLYYSKEPKLSGKNAKSQGTETLRSPSKLNSRTRLSQPLNKPETF